MLWATVDIPLEGPPQIYNKSRVEGAYADDVRLSFVDHGSGLHGFRRVGLELD